jgi:hypothetical protein
VRAGGQDRRRSRHGEDQDASQAAEPGAHEGLSSRELNRIGAAGAFSVEPPEG